MKVDEFEKLKKEYIEKYTDKQEKVKGYLKNDEDIKKANFNGVYIILDENDNIVYIGSAYTNKFTIMNRLKIHLNGHKSNATIVNYLVNHKKLNPEEAKKRIREQYKFIAYKCDSIEYKLIEDVDGLYNSKGIKK